MDVRVESIPAELKALPQWVVWSYETRAGKRTKVPYSPRTGKRAAVNDPDCWVGFEDAIAAMKLDRSASGVGFVFTAADPFAGIDIDHCIKDGEVGKEAASILEDMAGGYAEVSPSGSGLKIIVRAEVGDGRRGKGVEIYDRGRFFTLTGQSIGETPTTIGDCSQAVKSLIVRVAGKNESSKKIKSGVTARPPIRAFQDNEVIERIKQSKQGSKFEKLWAGDTSGYESTSEADLALCNILAFWSSGDPVQVDRLFRASGLMRGKWDEKRGVNTYGHNTLDCAFAGRSDFYHPYSEVLPAKSNVREGPSTNDKGFEWLSDLKRLDASEKWLWEGYINRGGITLLSALWKAGKTTLISHLLRGFQGGNELFCGKKISKAKVLVVTEEDDATWCERQDTLGIEQADSKHVGMICRPFVGRPDGKAWAEFIARTSEIIARESFDLVIIDTLAKLWPVKDENSASMVDEALMPLWELVSNGTTGLLLVHHLRKGDGLEATGSRGSGALTAFVETIVEFRRFDAASRNGTKRVLSGFGRFKETEGELVIDLTPAGYVPCGDRDDANALNLVEVIASILPKEPPGFNYGDIMENWPDESTPRRNVLLSTMRQGFDCGAFGRTGLGTKGSQYKYWLKPPNCSSTP